MPREASANLLLSPQTCPWLLPFCSLGLAFLLTLWDPAVLTQQLLLFAEAIQKGLLLGAAQRNLIQ